MTEPAATRRRSVEEQTGRLLIAVTYLSVVLLVVGVVLLLLAGVSPLDGGPGLDLGSLGWQLGTLDAGGFLWFGLLVVMATPVSRLVLAAVSFGRSGEWRMVAIALAVLLVMTAGAITAVAGTV